MRPDVSRAHPVGFRSRPVKSIAVISSLLGLAALFTSSPPAGEAASAPQYDLLILNGRVVDGTGRAAFAADLAVRGDRIVRVGKLQRARARRVIDARGLVVAPGFIDMLGQSEINLLIDPRAMSKVMQGVTTEVTGEGSTAAPMNERLVAEDADYYRRFNLTVDWRTLGEFFSRLEKRGMGVNVATFVGATQVRGYVIGFDDRPPTADELIEMRRQVASAMEDGALGVSTSLQYVPARFARTSEVVELAMAARRYGGIYATHQRSEANAIDASLEEVFEIGRRARTPSKSGTSRRPTKRTGAGCPKS